MSEIAILKARILQYLENKGISKYECYQKTGITNGVLSKKEGLSEDNLLRFISYYSDVNPNWLLTGESPMFRPGMEPIGLMDEEAMAQHDKEVSEGEWASSTLDNKELMRSDSKKTAPESMSRNPGADMIKRLPPEPSESPAMSNREGERMDKMLDTINVQANQISELTAQIKELRAQVDELTRENEQLSANRKAPDEGKSKAKRNTSGPGKAAHRT